MQNFLGDVQNFILIFGCPPSEGVPARTMMASDISRAMIDHCSRDCLLIFLDALDALQGRDVDLEIVTSATLRPLRLVYSYNVYLAS